MQLTLKFHTNFNCTQQLKFKSLSLLPILVYMSQCMPRVRISNLVQVAWVWSHKQTCSAKGITAHIFECMHMRFLPKSMMSPNLLWWHGWLSMMSLLKRYKRELACWVFQGPDFERSQGSKHNNRLLQCVPTWGLPGILNQGGLHVLVYCSFIIMHH